MAQGPAAHADRHHRRPGLLRALGRASPATRSIARSAAGWTLGGRSVRVTGTSSRRQVDRRRVRNGNVVVISPYLVRSWSPTPTEGRASTFRFRRDRDQVARALPPRIRRHRLCEDDLLVEPPEPFLGKVRLDGLPYRNVDLSGCLRTSTRTSLTDGDGPAPASGPRSGAGRGDARAWPSVGTRRCGDAGRPTLSTYTHTDVQGALKDRAAWLSLRTYAHRHEYRDDLLRFAHTSPRRRCDRDRCQYTRRWSDRAQIGANPLHPSLALARRQLNSKRFRPRWPDVQLLAERPPPQILQPLLPARRTKAESPAPSATPRKAPFQSPRETTRGIRERSWKSRRAARLAPEHLARGLCIAPDIVA